jgi:hypothetical protein
MQRFQVIGKTQNPRLVLYEVLCCAAPRQKSAEGVVGCSD